MIRPGKSGAHSRRPGAWLNSTPHWVWVFCVPAIIVMYIVPELIITENYHVTELAADRVIPYIPQFIVPYLLWFPMLAALGLWLLFRDGGAFRRYMWFLTAAYAAGTAVFLLFPNGQDLRPAAFDAKNLFTHLSGMVYTADTNTNVLPSMHVTGCFAVIFAVFDTPTLRSPVIRALAIAAAVLIIASTLFVKQHAILDVLASFAMSALLYLPIYRKRKN